MTQGCGSRLQLQGIHKHFGSVEVLRDIHLDIQPGELVCFLGPSGCGKTTLLRIIAGLEAQSGGRLLQGGRDISVLPPRQRDFGIVFQSYALFPNLSVRDNIAFGLRSQGLPKAAIGQRVSELLELIDLNEHADKYPAQLSGGQQQRVALARALAPAPGLLLLDEPLSALDARVRGHLRKEIRRLQQQLGVTSILVTHDQEEALTMADRVVVMNHGVIEQVGTPQEIYRQPASPFVAEFIGAMNFVDSSRDAAGLVKLGGQLLDMPNPAQQPGQRLRLAFRPEEIQLLPMHEGGLPARIEQLEFLGTFIRLRVRVEGLAEPLIVDVDARRARQLGLCEGQQLGMRLPADALSCFAA
ncbi:MAG: putative 2-aminoethylphosphonate ABC transporter ATP-binding protein [Pseudomonadaceae bacterium]|nr:putative 2-aminoethylphosphonate ABC transporter ATP-binding protein [Pseudomonadaceae bacterium]